MPRTGPVINAVDTAVPVSVSLKDLLEAMRPLYDLIGVDAAEIYSKPAMTIGCRADGQQAITFTAHPAVADRHPRKLVGTVVGDEPEFSEHAVVVEILVDL